MSGNTKKLIKRATTDQDTVSAILRKGRIGRLVQQIEKQADREVLQALLIDFKRLENIINPVTKAEWISELVEKLEQMVGQSTTTNIMQACGRTCCGIGRGEKANQLFKRSKNLTEFIRELNNQRLGGGRLVLVNRSTIVGGYDKCYCGLVNVTKTVFPTKTYCQCSAGWYKQFFEIALQQSVGVEILKSIISGAKTCEFIIHI